jgi:hypothetical protein
LCSLLHPQHAFKERLCTFSTLAMSSQLL